MPHARMTLSGSCVSTVTLRIACLCLFATWNMQSSHGQSLEPAEWASESSLVDDVISTEVGSEAEGATLSPQAQPATEMRTPIDRDHTPSTNGDLAGDARSTSWVWAWLPIFLASALWWLVNRLRRGTKLDQSLLPEGVVVPLGRRAVGAGQSVQLIRIGSRILVVTPTPEGLRTLTEITDPQEVERLVSLCLQPQQGLSSIGNLFVGRPIKGVDSSGSLRSTQSPARRQAQRFSQVAADQPEAAQ